jgi:hypothetical protein
MSEECRFAVHVAGPMQVYAVRSPSEGDVYHVAQLAGQWDQRVQFHEGPYDQAANGVTPEALLSVVLDWTLRQNSVDHSPEYDKAIRFVGMAIEQLSLKHHPRPAS